MKSSYNNKKLTTNCKQRNTRNNNNNTNKRIDFEQISVTSAWFPPVEPCTLYDSHSPAECNCSLPKCSYRVLNRETNPQPSHRKGHCRFDRFNKLFDQTKNPKKNPKKTKLLSFQINKLMCQRAKVTQNLQKIGLDQTEVATNFVYPFFHF